MFRSGQGPAGEPVKLVEQRVDFLGEQDGPPEKRLTARLSGIFVRCGSVQTAYLASVRYAGPSAPHVALCLHTANGEDETLVRDISAVFRSLFGGHEHLDTIFLKGSQESQVARVCKPFFAAPAQAAVETPPRLDPADFTPRMPEVDVPGDLAARFERARRIASGLEPVPGPGALSSGQRHMVIVTLGRMFMLHPCPPPGSMSASMVAAIEKIAPSSTRLSIAVIAFTDLRALREGFSKAIPFAGYVLGLAYVGHSVVVFEGHPSALKAGCQDGDMVVVDEAMIPMLQADWLPAAWSVMRAPQALVFGGNGALRRLTKK